MANQRGDSIIANRMISGLVLKDLNGKCFVTRRGYETARPVSSSFCLTVPAYSFVDCIHPLHRLADKHINLPQLLNYFLELVPLVCHPSSSVF
jgi:hypothetical protein